MEGVLGAVGENTPPACWLKTGDVKRGFGKEGDVNRVLKESEGGRCSRGIRVHGAKREPGCPRWYGGTVAGD